MAKDAQGRRVIVPETGPSVWSGGQSGDTWEETRKKLKDSGIIPKSKKVADQS